MLWHFAAAVLANIHADAKIPVSGGTFSLLDKFLPAKCGISVTFVSIADHAAVRAAITDRTKVICTASLGCSEASWVAFNKAVSNGRLSCR